MRVRLYFWQTNELLLKLKHGRNSVLCYYSQQSCNNCCSCITYTVIYSDKPNLYFDRLP